MSTGTQSRSEPSARASVDERGTSIAAENRPQGARAASPQRRRSSASTRVTPTHGDSTSRAEDKSARPKKRRKVTHACVYCQRSHMTCDQTRPCRRCIKRSIGHLCHDEPREGQKKAVKPEVEGAPESGDTLPQPRAVNTSPTAHAQQQQQYGSQGEGLDMASHPLQGEVTGGTSQFNRTTPADPLASINQESLNFDEWANVQDPFADLSNPFNPNYLFNSSELTSEYNLLNDFLNSSLLDDTALQGDSQQQMAQTSDTGASVLAGIMGNGNSYSVGPTNNQNGLQMPVYPSAATPRTTGPSAAERKKEAYYLTAADPGGTAPPEERMEKLLRAKIDAGLLRPFNYVDAWSALNHWMNDHISSTSKQRITQQLERFRPKFRERTENLTDVQLTQVEMWFERKLMEYDRVFASMAIPACCWRRTGGIYRGNREMAELLKIKIESLRDGTTALRDILTEMSLVDYWERFTAIAFDAGQKAILTECSLKTADGAAQLPCCFSFTVVRDTHQVPALIVGNFLPVSAE